MKKQALFHAYQREIGEHYLKKSEKRWLMRISRRHHTCLGLLDTIMQATRTVPKKILRGPSCFRKFLLSIFCIGGRKIFRLTVPKNFVGEHFWVSENFWYQKFLCIRGGEGYHDFPSKILRLTVPIKFIGEPFRVSINFWYRKILRIRGDITIICRKFFVSLYRKFS